MATPRPAHRGPARTGLGLILLALAGLAAPAQANDGEFYGSGADLYPIKNNSIAMDKETLVIEQAGPHRASYVDHWVVHVRYEFLNTTAAPVTVQMGFPEHCERTVEDMEVEAPYCKVPGMKGFTARVDGAATPVTIKTPSDAGALPGTHYDRVHTFSVSFKPNERKVVEHSYTHRGRIVSPIHSGVDYILKTGGLWHGPIRDFDLRVVLKGEWNKVVFEAPGALPAPTFQGWQGGTYQLRWQLKDFTPKGDLGLLLESPKGYEAVSDLRTKMQILLQEPEGLKALSPAELKVLRNTPYAYLGYTFKNKALAAHFAKAEWYRPRSDFDPAWLSAEELAFVKLVKAEEARRAGK